jgi:hypothetical protein
MTHVWKISLVRVVFVVFSVISVWKSFLHLFYSHNHLFYRVSEFFIVPWVFFAKILKLPLSHDSMEKGFNYFLFSNIMYLGA